MLFVWELETGGILPRDARCSMIVIKRIKRRETPSLGEVTIRSMLQKQLSRSIHHLLYYLFDQIYHYVCSNRMMRHKLQKCPLP